MSPYQATEPKQHTTWSFGLMCHVPVGKGPARTPCGNVLNEHGRCADHPEATYLRHATNGIWEEWLERDLIDERARARELRAVAATVVARLQASQDADVTAERLAELLFELGVRPAAE